MASDAVVVVQGASSHLPWLKAETRHTGLAVPEMETVLVAIRTGEVVRVPVVSVARLTVLDGTRSGTVLEVAVLTVAEDVTLEQCVT